MKEVAEEYDVELVDAGRYLDEDPADYMDICHFDVNGHRKIASLLYECIAGILLENKKLANFISARPENNGKQRKIVSQNNR